MRPAYAALRRVGLDWLAPPALGALSTLGFAPFGLYGLILLAFIGLLALWWSATPGQAAWRGWLFGLGQFGTGIYWVFVSVYVFGGTPLPVALLLVGLLVVYLALYPAAVGALAGTMRGLPRPAWALVFVPAAWLLAELVRAYFGTGFPWLSLGYSLVNAPVTGLAPLVGVYGLSALLVAAAGSLWLLLTGSLSGRLLALVLIVVSPLAIWWLPAPTSWTEPVGQPLPVAILQGDVPQDRKWLPENLAPVKQRYRELSASVEARLVVWPEAAIASLASLQQDYLQAIHQAALARGRTELIGILVYDPIAKVFYNAVLAVGTDRGRYYKRHLVPFGEYFPVPDFLVPLLDMVNMRYQSFAAGPEKQPLISVDGVALGISICFEDAFPREIALALPKAGILVNVTNDAWFADTTAPHQHLQIARMRALESGRPLLRAANTGISAVIGPDGVVRKRSKQFVPATLEAKVQPRAGTTPYVRYGNTPLWALALVLTLVGLAVARWRA